jgi:hypothetical protein
MRPTPNLTQIHDFRPNRRLAASRGGQRRGVAQKLDFRITAHVLGRVDPPVPAGDADEVQHLRGISSAAPEGTSNEDPEHRRLQSHRPNGQYPRNSVRGRVRQRHPEVEILPHEEVHLLGPQRQQALGFARGAVLVDHDAEQGGERELQWRVRAVFNPN